jgi:hypothetical protein
MRSRLKLRSVHLKCKMSPLGFNNLLVAKTRIICHRIEMNRNFISKLPSLVLLVAMLLNPLVGMAGSVLLDNSIHDVTSTEMSYEKSESCHGHAASNSSPLENDSGPKHSECCDEPCMCGQSGCHSPLATIGYTNSSLDVNSQFSYPNTATYLSPTLSSLTPPPII